MKNIEKIHGLSFKRKLILLAFVYWLSLCESVETIPARYLIWRLSRDKKTASL